MGFTKREMIEFLGELMVKAVLVKEKGYYIFCACTEQWLSLFVPDRDGRLTGISGLFCKLWIDL